MDNNKKKIFICNEKRDQLLKSFFCGWERPKDGILDLKKSGVFSNDKYVVTSFVYVAETNNHRLIKIGITSNPFGRLSYSRDYFGVSLSYIAVFCGCNELESFLLKSFKDLRQKTVNGKSAKEWFLNKERLNIFCNQLRSIENCSISFINDPHPFITS